MPGSSQRNSRNEKRNKKDGEDYIKASSHRDIAIWVGPFALRITKANSDLHLALTEFRVAATPLKIKSFLVIQIHQARMIMISKAKGTLS